MLCLQLNSFLWIQWHFLFCCSCTTDLQLNRDFCTTLLPQRKIRFLEYYQGWRKVHNESKYDDTSHRKHICWGWGMNSLRTKRQLRLQLCCAELTKLLRWSSSWYGNVTPGSKSSPRLPVSFSASKRGIRSSSSRLSRTAGPSLKEECFFTIETGIVLLQCHTLHRQFFPCRVAWLSALLEHMVT